MVSHSDEKKSICKMACDWLEGRVDRIGLDGLSSHELLVLWWAVAVYLHDRYGQKLRALEWCMDRIGMDIPRKNDELMQVVRYFFWESD